MQWTQLWGDTKQTSPCEHRKKVESIEIAADDLAVPFSNRIGMSQRKRCKEFAWSAVADGRVVLEGGKLTEKPIVTSCYPANPQSGETDVST